MFGMWGVGCGMFARMCDVDLQNALPERFELLISEFNEGVS